LALALKEIIDPQHIEIALKAAMAAIELAYRAATIGGMTGPMKSG